MAHRKWLVPPIDGSVRHLTHRTAFWNGHFRNALRSIISSRRWTLPGLSHQGREVDGRERNPLVVTLSDVQELAEGETVTSEKLQHLERPYFPAPHHFGALCRELGKGG